MLSDLYYVDNLHIGMPLQFLSGMYKILTFAIRALRHEVVFQRLIFLLELSVLIGSINFVRILVQTLTSKLYLLIILALLQLLMGLIHLLPRTPPLWDRFLRLGHSPLLEPMA